MNTPDWLTQRDGSLQLGSDGKTWFVLFANQAQYALVLVPVQGKFGCAIRQTNNGQRIESKGVQAGVDEALRAGLEDLRAYLGW